MRLKARSQRVGTIIARKAGTLRRHRFLQAIVSTEGTENGCRRGWGDEGAGIVEFALASTVLFALIFGIIEMSLALFTYHFISDAAREGTRWAMVRGSTSCTNTPSLSKCNAAPSDIMNYVKTLGYPGIDPTNMTVTPTYWFPDGTACTTGTCNAPGNAVQENVTYAFALSIPFWKATTLSLSSTSRIVISQ
jgi:Flp pilus assembly protein TadG